MTKKKHVSRTKITIITHLTDVLKKEYLLIYQTMLSVHENVVNTLCKILYFINLISQLPLLCPHIVYFMLKLPDCISNKIDLVFFSYCIDCLVTCFTMCCVENENQSKR